MGNQIRKKPLGSIIATRSEKWKIAVLFLLNTAAMINAIIIIVFEIRVK